MTRYFFVIGNVINVSKFFVMQVALLKIIDIIVSHKVQGRQKVIILINTEVASKRSTRNECFVNFNDN